jgi:type IV pili sensor histidine kinase/response regulator
VLQPDENQVDLLSSMVELELPEQINTVGQAITYLLEGSGYRLLSAKLAEPYRVGLFAMPLPDVQRQLGPLSLRQGLELLSGPAFRLVIEPVYRLVTFELVLPITTIESDDCPSR